MKDIDLAPPLILVPADVRPGDGYVWHAAPESYLAALADTIGAVPLVLPAIAALPDLDALLARVDGVLLTGSRSNVHPSCYSAPAISEAEPYDRGRDSLTLPLIAAVLRRGIPILAICRGLQELNVALGGTLIAEVHAEPGRDDHRATPSADADVRFAIAHDIAVMSDGLLAGILGAGTIRVNSLHRQAIGRLADGLRVEATAPDGTIEAVSVRDAAGFALGVQWHPEYWARTDPPSRQIFEAFGAAVRAYRAATAKATLTAE
jgi:putative glutamine amidotransferase